MLNSSVAVIQKTCSDRTTCEEIRETSLKALVESWRRHESECDVTLVARFPGQMG